jgi:hypothetical protein
MPPHKSMLTDNTPVFQMLPQMLHPDNVILCGTQWCLVLQDPFLTAVHGEGELKPHEEHRRVDPMSEPLPNPTGNPRHAALPSYSTSVPTITVDHGSMSGVSRTGDLPPFPGGSRMPLIVVRPPSGAR